MDTTAILNFVRDMLVIGYLFVLRIGVPLLIVFMYGAGIKKLLEERDNEPAAPETRPQAAELGKG